MRGLRGHPSPLNASAAGLKSATCYANNDSPFFSLMSSTDFNGTTCGRETAKFARALRAISEGTIRLQWSPNQAPNQFPNQSPHQSPNVTKPSLTSRGSNMIEATLKLPLYHKADNCSQVIVTEALLSDFAQKKGIGRREEWGARTQRMLNVNRFDLRVFDVIRRFFSGVLDCTVAPEGGAEGQARAGHQALGKMLSLFFWRCKSFFFFLGVRIC